MNNLIAIKSEDLKKTDKRGLATLYLYWLENGKKDVFDLPLFVDANGKGVLSVECFKRVFYAFCVKTNTCYNADIKSGSDGDDSNYNVVRVSKTDKKLDDVEFNAMFEQPKKADVKRESSKKTAEKSATKKAEASKKAEAESERLADDFAKKHSKKILDLVCGKYGLKLTPSQYSNLEIDLIAILKM